MWMRIIVMQGLGYIGEDHHFREGGLPWMGLEAQGFLFWV